MPFTTQTIKKISKKIIRYFTRYRTGRTKVKKTRIGSKINKRRLRVLQANVASSDDEEEGIGDNPHKFRVESDYFLIGFYINDSTCIINNVNHFIGPLRPINNRVVNVYGGMIKFRREVTLKWNIEDNDRNVHSVIIHNVNYLPESPICLILPQQWSHQADKNHPISDGIWCSTKVNNCTLHWDHNIYNCIIP